MRKETVVGIMLLALLLSLTVVALDSDNDGYQSDYDNDDDDPAKRIVEEITQNIFRAAEAAGQKDFKVTDYYDLKAEGHSESYALTIAMKSGVATRQIDPWSNFLVSYGHYITTVIFKDGLNVPAGFCGNTRVKTLRVADNVDIGKSALSNAGLLEKVTGIEVDSDGNYTDSLAKLNNVGQSAFYGCSSLVSDIEIHGNVDHRAFYACSSIGKISIVESNREYTFAEESFYGCGMKSLSITVNGKTNFGASSFKNCTSLINVSIMNSGNTNEAVFDSEVFSSSGKSSVGEPITFKSNCLFTVTSGSFAGANFTHYELDNVTLINNGAFSQSSVQNIKLTGRNNLIVQDSAFSNCVKMEEFRCECTSVELVTRAFTGAGRGTGMTFIAKEVTKIGDNAFDSSTLKSIVVERFSGSIGDNAFSGTKLEEFKTTSLTSNLTIGEMAFYNSFSLTTVVLYNVSSIGDSAFLGCSKLETVDIYSHSMVLSIGKKAFANSGMTNLIIHRSSATGETPVEISFSKEALADCASLVNFKAYQNTKEEPIILTCIPESLFSNCQKLAGLEVIVKNNYVYEDGTVATMAKNVFYNCADLKKLIVTVESNVTVFTVSDLCASSLNNLTSIAIELEGNVTEMHFGERSISGPKLVTVEITGGDIAPVVYFGDYSFINNQSLEKIVLFEKSDLYIGKSAFKEAVKLEKFCSVDNIIKQVDDEAFSGCSVLDNIGTIQLDSSDDVTRTIGEKAFANCSLLDNVIIECDGPWILDDYGFAGCGMLTELDISKCEHIGKEAFSGCSKIVLDTSNGLSYLKSIGIGAFKDCAGITNMNLSKSTITVIPEYMISASSSSALSKVVLPKTIVKIEDGAFLGCGHLTYINLEDCVNLTYIGEHAFESVSLSNVTIPNNVTELGSSAFKKAAITYIILPEKLEIIGSFAFEGCGKLKEISVPDSVKSIGASTFAGCAFLEKVKLPNNSSFITINSSTFEACTRLMDITIPGSVKEIGQRAFASCTGLNNIYCENSHIEIIGSEAFRGCVKLISIDCSTVKHLGDYAFAECEGMVSITMPDTLFENELKSNLFFKCSQLSSIIIPSNIVTIGDSCFNGCSMLKTVCIPSTVTTIGEYAFSGCSTMTQIYSVSGMPMLETLGAHCFENDEALQFFDCDLTNVTDIPDYAFYKCKLLEFPKEYPAVSVVKVGLYAFYSSGIVTVNINSVLSYFGDYAFAECKNLTSVTIYINKINAFPNHVFENCSNAKFVFKENQGSIAVGDYAFCGCSELTEFQFASITSLGKYAFAYCNKIDMGNTKIDTENDAVSDYAFYMCGNGVSLNGIEKMKSIGKHAYDGCFIDMIEPIDFLLEEVEFVDEYAFSYCDGLNISFGENIRRIQNYAFAGCNIVSDIHSEELINIGQYAFTEAVMTSITVYGSYDLVVDKYAFSYCPNLERAYIVIAKSVSETAFVGCSSIKDLFIDDGNVKVVDGVAYSKDLKTLRFVVTRDLNYVDVPADTMYIAAGAFSGWNNIIQVNLLGRIVSIGDNAFTNCYYLREINGLSKVSSIGKGAFDNCWALNNVTLSVNLTQLGDYTFRNCRSMDIFEMSPSIRTIGKGCFEGCSKLEVIDTYKATDIGDYAFKGCESMTTIILPEVANYLGEGLFENCYSLVNYKLPSGITSIPSYMFRNCKSILSIVVPDTVTSIGESAFENSGVKRAIISEKVKIIGEKTFYQCWNLVELELPRTLTTIKEYAFSKTGMQSVTLPYSLKEIGAHAFEGCPNLIGVTMRGSVSIIGDYAFAECVKLTGIDVSNAVKEFGKAVFYNCSSLTNASLPDSITVVPEDTFNGCEKLSSVILGSGLEIIEAHAFKDCRNLVNIRITDNVKKIEEEAFLNCERLRSINIPRDLELIGEDAYAGCISVEKITVDDFNTHFVYENNGLYSLSNSLKKQVFIKYVSCERTTLVLPETIVRIDSYAVYDCDNLIYIQIPAVSRIGDYCFCECDNLMEVSLSTDINGIGDHFLTHCLNLTTITTGENNGIDGLHYRSGVLYFDNDVVVVDGSFKGVFTLNEETVLRPGALDYAKNITGFENFNPDYGVSSDGLLIKKGGVLVKAPNNIKSVSLPDVVKTVNPYAISFCKDLESIVVDKNVKFESSAVYSCPTLDKIEINADNVIFEPQSICAGTASKHANVHIVSEYDYSDKIEGVFDQYTSGMIGYEPEESILPIVIAVIAVVLLASAVCVFVYFRKKKLH